MTYNRDKGKQTKFLSPSPLMDGSSKVGNVFFPRVAQLQKGIRRPRSWSRQSFGHIFGHGGKPRCGKCSKPGLAR